MSSTRGQTPDLSSELPAPEASPPCAAPAARQPPSIGPQTTLTARSGSVPSQSSPSLFQAARAVPELSERICRSPQETTSIRRRRSRQIPATSRWLSSALPVTPLQSRREKERCAEISPPRSGIGRSPHPESALPRAAGTVSGSADRHRESMCSIAPPIRYGRRADPFRGLWRRLSTLAPQAGVQALE